MKKERRRADENERKLEEVRAEFERQALRFADVEERLQV
jgi:predicted glycoside hydrolase/deacetylase ChbG (UPF0249 family)